MPPSRKTSIFIALLVILVPPFRAIIAAPTHEAVADVQHQQVNVNENNHDQNLEHESSSLEVTARAVVTATSNEPELKKQSPSDSDSDVQDKNSGLNSKAATNASKFETVVKSHISKPEKNEDEAVNSSKRPKRQNYGYSCLSWRWGKGRQRERDADERAWGK